MKTIIIATSVFFLCLLAIFQCVGQNNLNGIHEVESVVRKGLRFLYDTQKKETKGIEYFKGEWGSRITNRRFFPMLIRRGKTAYDSNCFTTASVHNILAETYLRYPKYNMIPKMLRPAVENIMMYEKGGNFTFNFWHYLPRVEHLQKKKHKQNPEKYMQHRPNNFIFRSKFINNCANVCDDADDTALSLAALKLNKKIAGEQGKEPVIEVPDSIGHIFSRYRNINRKKTHFYNLFFSKRKYIKGAFCTWFGEETKFTGFGFMPATSKQDRYIPYNANEVDCIVNANVLITLNYYDELETPGVDKAVRMLKNSVSTRNCNKCGIYYPSEFTLHYLVSKLIKLGMTDFNEAIPAMLDRISNSQREDGSWKSKIKGNELQVTLYALITMLNIGDVQTHNTLPLIEKAMEYVMDKATITDQHAYWEGGVFFSGGTVIRKSFLWRSDAVTTALALTALLKYDELKKTIVAVK